ncbi:MAG: hypothetical protein H0V84_00475 [Actinobacteria bacterium]|nr:hypothetical protein [Actinomycetota bacterium]
MILPLLLGAAALGAVLAVLVVRDDGDEEPPRALRGASGFFFGGAPQQRRAEGQGGAERRNEAIRTPFDVFEAAAALRAYPRPRIEYEQAEVARSSFTRLPLAAVTNAEGGRSSWRPLGAARYQALPSSHTQNRARPETVSGRITALAIGRRCRTGDCKLWVGAAGGGVYRTANALSDSPRWVAASTGLTSSAIGTLTLDPNDRTGNTLYAGTGELGATGDSEAGTGVFKSTDGGATWELLEGSGFAENRAVSGVLVHPRNPDTIYVSTASSFRGSSSVAGGHGVPPDAQPAGVYRSNDGGRSFERLFTVKGPTPFGGVTRDVNQIALDPNDPATVYASVIGRGLYRLSRRIDRDGSFHLVFSTMNRSFESFGRVQFALADLGARTRIYLGDSDPGASFGTNGRGVADLFRLDDANVRAPKLTRRGVNRLWKRLSNPLSRGSAYDSYRYCQEQCEYTNVVASPPGEPNTVWLGGMFQYEEAWQGGSNGRTIVRSTDAGVRFTDLSADAQSPAVVMHPDQHVIVFSPGNPDIAFLGSDGGLVRTSSTYVTASANCRFRDLDAPSLSRCSRWLSRVPSRLVSLNVGLPTLQLQSISTGPVEGEILAGAQDNGTWAYSPRTGWRQTAAGDGGQSGISPSNPRIRFHTYYGSTISVNFRGTDPAGWNYVNYPLGASGEATSFYMPVAVDPRVPGTMFVGLQHVWRTKKNGGARSVLEARCNEVTALVISAACGDWVPLGADLTGPAFGNGRFGRFVVAVERAPSDARTLWAATLTGRVFVTATANAPAKAVVFRRIDRPTKPRRPGTPGRFVSSISVDPKNPRHAWVSYSGYNAYTLDDEAGHVFEVTVSAAGRAVWKNLSFNLGDQPITDLVRHPKTGDLYAATDFGVLRLPPRGARWTEAARGMPPVAVFGLTLSRSGRTLYAATHGRGAWELPLGR